MAKENMGKKIKMKTNEFENMSIFRALELKRYRIIMSTGEVYLGFFRKFTNAAPHRRHDLRNRHSAETYRNGRGTDGRSINYSSWSVNHLGVHVRRVDVV